MLDAVSGGPRAVCIPVVWRGEVGTTASPASGLRVGGGESPVMKRDAERSGLWRLVIASMLSGLSGLACTGVLVRARLALCDDGVLLPASSSDMTMISAASASSSISVLCGAGLGAGGCSSATPGARSAHVEAGASCASPGTGCMFGRCAVVSAFSSPDARSSSGSETFRA